MQKIVIIALLLASVSSALASSSSSYAHLYSLDKYKYNSSKLEMTLLKTLGAFLEKVTCTVMGNCEHQEEQAAKYNSYKNKYAQYN